MDKKLPKVFANKFDKKISNNNTVFYSASKEKSNALANNKAININKKISNIFNSNSFVYKKEVKIILHDQSVVKQVIGRNQKNLITIDNELIPIKDIIDIEV